MIDRNDLIGQINNGRSVVLEIGCGPVREQADSITIDIRNLPEVDICGDVYEVLSELRDSTVEGVLASHFIEHIDDLPRLLEEIVRVCRHESEIKLIAPHFSNAFFYSDYTHRNFFGLYTFCYLAESRVGFSRKVPDYGQISGLVLEGVRLGFKSYRPFYVRHGLRKIVGFLVNSCNYMKELYEEAGTGFVSCYELEYRLVVKKEP